MIIPSNPEDRKKIEGVLREISNSLTRIAAEREHINECLATMQEDFELPKKHMRKVAKIYHNRNISEVKQEFSDIEDMYTAVTS